MGCSEKRTFQTREAARTTVAAREAIAEVGGAGPGQDAHELGHHLRASLRSDMEKDTLDLYAPAFFSSPPIPFAAARTDTG